MATIDFTKPVTTDNYSTTLLPGIVEAHKAIAQMLDPADVTITGASQPVGAKQLDSANGLFKKWTGSAWTEVVLAYAKLASANFTVLQVGGNSVFHAGNFNPANYLALAGGVMTGEITAAGTTGVIGDATTEKGKVAVMGVSGAGNGAFLELHRPGIFACYFGLDSDSNLKIGGHSFGATAHKVWHGGQQGAASGMDSDLLDGQHGSFYQSASNLNAGTIPSARLSGAYTGITGLGTITTQVNVIGVNGQRGQFIDHNNNAEEVGFQVRNQSTGNAAAATTYLSTGISSAFLGMSVRNNNGNPYLWMFAGVGITQSALLDLCAPNLHIRSYDGATEYFVLGPGGLNIKRGAFTTPVAVTFGATPTFDAALSNVFNLGTMTGNVTGPVIGNPHDGQTITIRVKQDATGGRTFAAFSNSTISGSIGTVANKVSLLTVTYNGTDTKWEGAWTVLP